MNQYQRTHSAQLLRLELYGWYVLIAFLGMLYVQLARWGFALWKTDQGIAEWLLTTLGM